MTTTVLIRMLLWSTHFKKVPFSSSLDHSLDPCSHSFSAESWSFIVCSSIHWQWQDIYIYI